MWRNGESPAEAGLNPDVQLTVECPHYLPAISLFPGGTYDKSTELSFSLSMIMLALNYAYHVWRSGTWISFPEQCC